MSKDVLGLFCFFFLFFFKLFYLMLARMLEGRLSQAVENVNWDNLSGGKFWKYSLKLLKMYIPFNPAIPFLEMF